MKRLAKYTFVTLACFGLVRAEFAHGGEAQPTEYQLKAAFLFNFAKFVEWPSEAFTNTTAPVLIGILGQSSSATDLEQTIQNKTINNRPLKVVREVQSLTEATNCHILFISASEAKRLPEILASLRGASVLTVGDEVERFTETGGMINFVVEEKKIRFQINNEAAKDARLKISSKLLSLAWRPAR